MTRQTTIKTDDGAPRRSLQIEKRTDAQIQQLIDWGYAPNLTEVVRHAIREAWERQITYQEATAMNSKHFNGMTQYEIGQELWAIAGDASIRESIEDYGGIHEAASEAVGALSEMKFDFETYSFDAEECIRVYLERELHDAQMMNEELIVVDPELMVTVKTAYSEDALVGFPYLEGQYQDGWEDDETHGDVTHLRIVLGGKTDTTTAQEQFLNTSDKVLSYTIR